jgi:hypothetical protein
MNRAALLMRDPAAAAAFGALPDDGSDFGQDWYDADEIASAYEQFGDYAGDFGYDPSFGYNPSVGDDFGSPFNDMLAKARGVAAGAAGLTPAQRAQLQGLAAPSAVAAPQVAALFAHASRTARETNAREMLLEPNKNSTTKIERFVFALNQTITALGTGQALSMRDTPDTNIRPQRVTANSPSPGFVTFNTLRVGNIDVLSGSIIDSFDFNANGQGQSLDMPTLKTATKLTVAGTYSGLVPSPLTGTGAYVFTVSFKGPATLSP